MLKFGYGGQTDDFQNVGGKDVHGVLTFQMFTGGQELTSGGQIEDFQNVGGIRLNMVC